MNGTTLPRVPKRAVISVGLIVLVGTLWFIATHGVLKVDTDIKGQYTYRKISDDETEKSVSSSSWNFVASGQHEVEFKTAEDMHIIKQVEVPTFLRWATVSFAQVTQRRVEKVASSTLEHIMLGRGDAIVSTNTTRQTQTFLVHSPDDPTGLNADTRNAPPLVEQAIISNNQLITLAADISGGTIEQTPYSLQVLDFTRNTTKTVKKDYVLPALVRPSSAHNNVYGVFQGDDGKLSLDVYDGTELRTTFRNLSGAAEGDEGFKVAAISKEFIAVGYGQSYTTPADTDEHSIDADQQKEAEQDYIIRIYDLQTGREVRSINIGRISAVASIQLTDDGKYVSVVRQKGLKVYDTFKSTQVFSYDNSFVMSPQWLNNERLLFGTADNGLYEIDVKTRTASTLFSTTMLRISTFSVVANEVLFTAYSNRPTADSPTPDGYTVFLDREAADDNALIKKLPYQDEQIKLAALRNTIYAAKLPVESRRDPEGNFLGPEFRPVSPVNKGFRTNVMNYLQENMKDYEQYELVFGENL